MLNSEGRVSAGVPQGGLWGGTEGCPPSTQENMPAEEALPLSLVPPPSQLWDVVHLLGCRHQPHLDVTGLGVVRRAKLSSRG